MSLNFEPSHWKYSIQSTLIDLIAQQPDFWDHRRKLYARRNYRAILLNKITEELRACFPEECKILTSAGKS